MGSRFTPLLFLLLMISIPFSSSSKSDNINNKNNNNKLSLDYYKKTCPDFDRIVREQIQDKQSKQPTTAAGTVRILLHDCMVSGCDGSILIASNSFNKAERDADINLSLPGDALDVVSRIKTILELSCPGVVSCSDILAEAARDLIVMQGGPFYTVPLGRKDGLVSKAETVEGNLPRSNMSMDQMLKIFEVKGFSAREMVALMGAHTIGFAHCTEFKDRIYKYSKKTPTDPEINPKYAEALKSLCANDTDGTMSAFNDVLTPTKFDNMYFKNLPRGLAALASDHMLIKDPRTKGFAEWFAANQTAFFEEFGRGMQKLGALNVKTGNDGEVRRRCDTFNDDQT
ncbi:hypothetical protein LWI28_028339 [Acer negundo]|uniref:Peroxidase n=1 Tax=Acer negundo TaxID=4023 RepID=A0AAD5NR07_ACENE|nr:hypothetical protein LWI28_028339 [Acer negundo]KAK4843393.1 hypothetical protein QYF36_007551 [Acer negundo]